MDQYPQYQGNPNQGNPYDFILNPEQQKPKKFSVGGKDNFIFKIVMIIGGTIIFFIVTALIISALAPKKIDNQEFIGLAQSQQELIRISNQASAQAKQQTTKNLATTIQYTMITQQKLLVTMLGERGVKVSGKQLTLKQNATTDQKFTSAKSTSTYDQTFIQVVQEELTAYASELKRLEGISTSNSERERLTDYNQQTQMLISQIPYTADKLDSAGTNNPTP
ncbi:MAG TPA: hypothetical protein VF733_05985 [Candidatus Saccharimonadales bacterium]